MATETLRPNGAGDETNLTIGGSSPAATNYESVDEASADDDVTLVHNNRASRRDLYAAEDHSIGSGIINKITVYVRCKTDGGAGGYCYCAIKSDSTVTCDTSQALTTSWADYHQDWTINPADSAAWEWADIDALQIGTRLTSTVGEEISRCTQVYVVVDYTPVVFVPRITTII